MNMSRCERKNANFARDLEGLVLSMPIVQFYGVRLVSIEPGDVEVEMSYRDELTFVPLGVGAVTWGQSHGVGRVHPDARVPRHGGQRSLRE